MPDKEHNDFLSRTEFEQFEKSVAHGFDRVNVAIDGLTREIKGIAGRGTNWTAIWGGLTVLGIFATSVGGIVAYGISSRIDGLESRCTSEMTRLSDGVDNLRELRYKHEENGHPHTVMDRIDRLEILLDEVRHSQ